MFNSPLSALKMRCVVFNYVNHWELFRFDPFYNCCLSVQLHIVKFEDTWYNTVNNFYKQAS